MHFIFSLPTIGGSFCYHASVIKTEKQQPQQQ